MSIKKTVKLFVPEGVILERKLRGKIKDAEMHKKLSEDGVRETVCQTYEKHIGVRPNLDSPHRFTEKIQWRKLYGTEPIHSRLSDKYAVREWVANRIGDGHLIPLIGVWGSPGEIDFDGLPSSFVLKTNNASGTNIIVKEKSTISKKKVRKQLQKWLDWDFGWTAFEPQYLSIPKRIIAEKYLQNSDGTEINDYKFLCFDGKAEYVWVDVDRFSDHARCTFDLGWNLQPWNFGHFKKPSVVPNKPDNFEKLVELVNKLAEGFDAVRIDFYVIDGVFYFGEMTFTSGGGNEGLQPDCYDEILGAKWHLDTSSPRFSFHDRSAG